MKPKRNKKYTPRPCVLPLNMRRAIAFELPGYVASLALGQDHFCEQHVYDLLSNADMVRRIAPDGHPILATAAADGAGDRRDPRTCPAGQVGRHWRRITGAARRRRADDGLPAHGAEYRD